MFFQARRSRYDLQLLTLDFRGLAKVSLADLALLGALGTSSEDQNILLKCD